MIFPLASVSRPALGPTQPPVQWVPGVLSPGVKARPGRYADHSPPSSAEVENEYELYILSPQAPSWRVAGLLYFTRYSDVFNLLLRHIGLTYLPSYSWHGLLRRDLLGYRAV
jgi:hypothetical protein